MSDQWQAEPKVLHYDLDHDTVWTNVRPPQAPERTPQQQHTDHGLTQAEDDARKGLEFVESAVAWLASVNGGHVKNREAPHYVLKLVEEIAEVRRVRQ